MIKHICPEQIWHFLDHLRLKVPLNVLFKIPTSMIKIATYLNPMDLNPTNRIVIGALYFVCWEHRNGCCWKLLDFSAWRKKPWHIGSVIAKTSRTEPLL